MLKGFNGTIFAYGQTGCGKSFTMEGIPNPPIHRGITPRSFEHIFQECAVRENTKFLIRASYLEIYNEQIRDLLSVNVNQRLDLREDPDRGVYVKDLSLHDVHNVAELIQLMAKGTTNRSTGATAMNADSSRSHSIFTVWIEMCESIDGHDRIFAGKLNLVDLAGSERQSKTQAEGARLKEATKINLSLSALGNVISALVDGKAKHIPYRDSKLTRLLQDSLGGNTKTLMIAAISPADNNYDETMSTLRYANRAKNIKNSAKINEDPKDALLRQYQEEIAQLKALLAGQIEGTPWDMNGAVHAPDKAPSDRFRRAARQSVTSDAAEEIAASISESTAEIRAELEREKEVQLAEIEARLKAEYDSKLEAMEEKMLGPDVADPGELEHELEKITEDYHAQVDAAKAEHEAQIKAATPPPPAEPSEPRLVKAPRKFATVIDSAGRPLIALVDDDGTLLKATLGEDGQLRPAEGVNGERITLPGATQVPQPQDETPPAAPEAAPQPAKPAMRFVPTTVVGPNGAPLTPQSAPHAPLPTRVLQASPRRRSWGPTACRTGRW